MHAGNRCCFAEGSREPPLDRPSVAEGLSRFWSWAERLWLWLWLSRAPVLPCWWSLGWFECAAPCLRIVPHVAPASFLAGYGMPQVYLMHILRDFVEAGLFPIDPKRVPACISGELELPLIDESCTPFAAKQRRFSPEERRMIREKSTQSLTGA